MDIVIWAKYNKYESIWSVKIKYLYLASIWFLFGAFTAQNKRNKMVNKQIGVYKNEKIVEKNRPNNDKNHHVQWILTEVNKRNPAHSFL